MIDKKEIPVNCDNKQKIIEIFDKSLNQDDLIKQIGSICSTCIKRYSCPKRVSQNIA